jgi:hypothetical protein
LDVSLERLDGPGSPYAYDMTTIISGRRTGKTVTTMGVPLVKALAGPVTLPNGRRLPFRAAHTAQNLTQARKRFLEDLVEPMKHSMALPHWARAAKLYRNLNNTSLTLDPRLADVTTRDASTIQVYAPTPSSVRGDGLLNLTFDEALVFSLAEGEALMGSARPVMSEFGGHAQMYVCTNISAQTTERAWISKLRDQGRAAVQAGRTTGVAYLEYSLPRGSDVLDERLWWLHYPALGDGLVGLEQLRRDLEELGPVSFGAEYLGAWPDEVGTASWVAITEASFTGAAEVAELPADVPYSLGVAIDQLGRDATISAAALTGPAGQVRVEILATGPDSRWVAGELDRITERAGPAAAVAIADVGPGHGLLMDLQTSGHRLVPIGSKDYPAACFDLETGLADRSVTYRPHPALATAASAARHTPGKAWVWDHRVDVSQTPVDAATLAAWAARHHAGLQFYVY